MIVLIAVVALTLGVSVGSFLNVVISRLPRGESVVTPSSHCVICGHQIRARHNIPVVSWFWLRGRCYDCGAKFSPVYMIVELGCGAIYLAIGFWLALDISAQRLMIALALAWFFASAIVLSVIDIRHRVLPNQVVLALYLAGISLLSAASFFAGSIDSLKFAGVGMVTGFLAMALASMLSRGSMGFGDVKLAGALGFYLAWFGAGALFVGAVAAFFCGAIYGLILILIGRANGRSSVAFGPWMLLGATVGILAGNQIWATYIDFIYQALS